MQPGGIIKAGGQWIWLPLFEAGPLQDTYELTITGQTGPVGTGNYKGLWIDAIRFEDLSGSELPRSAAETGLPGRWKGMPWLTTSSPMRHGVSCTVPAAKGRLEPSVLLQNVFERPVDATDNDLFCVWLTAHQHVASLRLALADEHGRRITKTPTGTKQGSRRRIASRTSDEKDSPPGGKDSPDRWITRGTRW